MKEKQKVVYVCIKNDYLCTAKAISPLRKDG